MVAYMAASHSRVLRNVGHAGYDMVNESRGRSWVGRLLDELVQPEVVCEVRVTPEGCDRV